MANQWAVFSPLVAALLSISVSPSLQYCSTKQSIFSPNSSTYLPNLLNPLLNHYLNPLDYPVSVSQARICGPVNTLSVPFEDIKYYAYFAASIYCPYTIKDLSCCYCQFFNSTVSQFELFGDGLYGTKALVTVHDSKREIVVTFRGSVALMNWVMDFFLLRTKVGENVKLHRGVYLSTMSLYNDVVQYLGRVLTSKPTYRVVITGHSLGGGMASIFTYLLTYLDQFSEFNTQYVLVSLAQTRVGNRYYADYMNALNIPIARVTSVADIIPHLIPVNYNGLLLLPLLHPNYYVHHGQEVWVNGKNVTYCSKARYEDPACSYSQGPIYSIVDHPPYLDTNMFNCYVVEGLVDVDLLTLPNGWTPTDYLPPMPSKIADFFGKLVDQGYQGLNPYL